MTTIESVPADTSDTSDTPPFLAALADWITSTDHKKLGRLLAGGGLLGLLTTIVVNLLIAVERVDGSGAALDVDSWSQLITAQRVGLVFGAGLPLAAGLAVAVTPLQLGARSIAFPRLVGTGVWMWFGGFVLSIISISANGGFGGGDPDMVDLFLAAHGLMALGLLSVGVALVTSVLTTRAPGMTMRRVPFFAWSTMVFGIGLVLVMPVFVGTLIYLFVDHRSGTREAFGGNDGIATWAGWMFTQPATFLLAIPALGLFADLLPTTFKKRTPLRGAVFAGLSLVLVSALGAVTQQIRFDVPWSGSLLYIGDGDDVREKVNDVLPWGFFHVLPIVGAGILFLMAAFLAKPEKDESGQTIRPNITAAFLFAFFGYGMVLVGMHGAAIEPIVDLDLIGTVFGEAVLVYVVYGAALGVLGGLAYWAPKLWGVELDLKKTAPLALLGVGGVVLASFPHYIAGFLDQPAGLAYDDSDLQIWNIVVLVGHALFFLAAFAFVGLLVSTVVGRDGSSAPDDPSDGHTIEWATTSPAPTDNFVDVPAITSAEPMLDLRGASASDQATPNPGGAS
ncbi:MAG: cbb3-type cytochrome c oxidase subunit I [Actinomycetota bacterium]